jgi:hypothetical protein
MQAKVARYTTQLQSTRGAPKTSAAVGERISLASREAGPAAAESQ